MGLTKRIYGGVTRIVNRGLQGAVDGGNINLRLGVQPIDPHEPRLDTSDHYGGTGGRISIEGARMTQLQTQEGLDQEIVDENTYGSAEHRHGLLPCQRVGREGTGGTGRRR